MLINISKIRITNHLLRVDQMGNDGQTIHFEGNFPTINFLNSRSIISRIYKHNFRKLIKTQYKSFNISVAEGKFPSLQALCVELNHSKLFENDSSAILLQILAADIGISLTPY